MERPAKKAKLAKPADVPDKAAELFSGSDSSDDSGVDAAQGVSVEPTSGLKINADFAKRFEHNKKREERQRLEEKFKSNGKRALDDDLGDDDAEGSSTSESEDSVAELATEELDQEISATLEAIRKKDPRIYDSSTRFISEFEAETAEKGGEKKKEKPMYLQDYHRRNLLEGNADGEEDTAPPPTYQQEQDSLRRDVVGQMHAEPNEGSGSEDDGFLIKKKKSRHDDLQSMQASKNKKKIDVDISTADKDPETFLSNFMAARAWLPTDGSRFQPMNSDDSDEEARADEFEAAYNLRFEDPRTANEKLMSFGRDVGKYSVRRDEVTGRKKQREQEREKKAQLKQARQDERARLRKLKIEEVEERVKRIKEAAGLRGKDALDLGEWSKVLEEDWDDDRWEDEMNRRFGDKYYAEEEARDESDDEAEDRVNKKRKVKKPKWEDDIDIKDLVPEFDDEESNKANFTLSSDDEADGGAPIDAEDHDAAPVNKSMSKKDRQKEKSDQKRTARKERQKIEELVDHSLPLAHPTIMSTSTSKAPVTGFRYRETSPSSFGLTPRDILFAEDAQLNQYAGLKKMAAFRDPEKKSRDKKKLSKKARLRQWRKDTFGAEDGPRGEFGELLGRAGTDDVKDQGEADGSNGAAGSRKKRGKKRKAKAVEA